MGLKDIIWVPLGPLAIIVIIALSLLCVSWFLFLIFFFSFLFLTRLASQSCKQPSLSYKCGIRESQLVLVVGNMFALSWGREFSAELRRWGALSIDFWSINVNFTSYDLLAILSSSRLVYSLEWLHNLCRSNIKQVAAACRTCRVV